HAYATTWSNNADKHWHECSRCGDKADEAAHTPDREAATETDPIKCSECDYEIAPALGVQDYTIDLPVSLAVKLTGDEKPAKETFKFEIYNLGYEDAEFEILNDSVVVENLEFDENGVAFVGGIIKIKVTGEDQLCNLTEGFSVRMVKGSTKGWTYASEQWHIEPFFENDALDIGIAVKEIVDGEISEEYANGMSFAVSYEAVTEPIESTDPQPEEPADPTESSEPTKPATPETGANSNMFLWIALLFVSGCGIFGATIYGKKKKENAE
ncbi:MAG: LPXTG cell wall anchor domain-containing protein, partial [Clostridiales bacterium]|nr:LPXTG cell wall anchor domain-containing protein [Clostridiales bacterium]